MKTISKLKYLKYQRYELISVFLGASVWVSLGTFSIITKANLGIDILTFMETVIFIASILGVHLAFKQIGNFSQYVLFNLLTETIFLIAILYLTYNKSMFIAISIYVVIIISKMLNPIINEKARNIEDLLFKKKNEKMILANIRMKEGYITNIAGVLGSLIAILALTILNIDVYTFAMYMLCLNIMQNIFDYYKWVILLK